MTMRIDCFGQLDIDQMRSLAAGESIEITGDVVTLRDAAAMRIAAMTARGEKLPMNIAGRLLYAVGPSPAKPGQVVGSAGPTTTDRLSPFFDALFAAGVRGVIGKGELHGSAEAAFRRHETVYLAAIGGLGALLGKTVKETELLAFPDLGPEAVYRFRVVDFPAVVIIDLAGTNYHDVCRAAWRRVSS